MQSANTAAIVNHWIEIVYIMIMRFEDNIPSVEGLSW